MSAAIRVSLFLAVLAACSSSESSSGPADAGDPSDGGNSRIKDGEPSDEDASRPPAKCERKPAADDRIRKMVVSHPYGPGSAKANQYEVLDVATTGELTRTSKTFEMGRLVFGDIVFTRDGKVGIVAQDDGTVGVFTFDDSGGVQVVHAKLQGDFYAQRVVVSPDSQRVFVLDAQTKEHDGGVYELAIGCDGTLTSKGLVVPGGQAHVMTFLPGSESRALLIAGGALDAPSGSYAHLIDFGGQAPTRSKSAPVFPDSNAIASWVSVTPDGKYALVTDNNSIGAGSRMAPIALDTFQAGAVIATPNPVAVAMSPFGNAALVLNSDGEDALRVVKYDPANAAAPFIITKEVVYKGGKSELPTTASVIDRGALKGHIFVGENVAVRHLTFNADGSVTDKALVSFGDDIPAIIGGIGVQP